MLHLAANENLMRIIKSQPFPSYSPAHKHFIVFFLFFSLCLMDIQRVDKKMYARAEAKG